MKAITIIWKQASCLTEGLSTNHINWKGRGERRKSAVKLIKERVERLLKRGVTRWVLMFGATPLTVRQRSASIVFPWHYFDTLLWQLFTALTICSKIAHYFDRAALFPTSYFPRNLSKISVQKCQSSEHIIFSDRRNWIPSLIWQNRVVANSEKLLNTHYFDNTKRSPDTLITLTVKTDM